MKTTTSLLACFLVASAGSAMAQSSVTIYGTLDAGLVKRTGASVAVGKRDANTLGFRGSEELGGGLTALYHLEIRYEPDTGTTESVVRPLFQGQSRVGLKGGFGTVRIGRGTSPLMAAVIPFDTHRGTPSPVGFYSDLVVSGYTSQPLDAAGNSFNRMSNAVFYDMPALGGLQVSSAVGTRESSCGCAIVGTGTAAKPQYAAGAQGSANPFSLAGTYKFGAASALVAFERNAIESELWLAGVSINPVPALKLMATYSEQDRSHTMLKNAETRAWVMGANYQIGSGTILAGFGRKMPEGAKATRQISIGYEHALSKRTLIYTDISSKKAAATVRHLDLGIRHNF